MRLYLVQHANAIPKEDHSKRPLSKNGFKEIKWITSFFKQNGAINVYGVWYSTKQRAKQTADGLVKGLKLKASLKEVKQIAPKDDIHSIVKSLTSQSANIMLVGHRPHLTKLASYLVTGDENAESFNFQQCCVLCLERKSTGNTAKNWTVQWMVTPHLVKH